MTAQQILDDEAQKILEQILAQVRNAVGKGTGLQIDWYQKESIFDQAIKQHLIKMGFEIVDSHNSFIISWQHLTPNLTPKPLIAEWD